MIWNHTAGPIRINAGAGAAVFLGPVRSHHDRVGLPFSPCPNYHSPFHSRWYGQDSTGDYDTGGTNSGMLISPSIWIPPGVPAELHYWQWYETEPLWLPQAVYSDRYHDTDGDDNISGGLYTEWANALGVDWAVDEYDQPISLATLSGYDVLALFDPEIAFTGDEMAAINAFLQSGGRAVLLGEAGDFQGVNTQLNALSAAHGITFNSDVVGDSTDNDGSESWPLIYSFAKVPPVYEVGTVVIFSGCSLLLSGSAEPLVTGDGDTSTATLAAVAMEAADEYGQGTEGFAQPQHIVPGAPVVMASAPVGQGEIIAIGDSDLWSSADPDGDGTLALFEYQNPALSYRAFGKVTKSPYFDRMSVRVSAAGAPFVDVLNLDGGPMAAWQPATVDLTPFAGSVVRVGVRFDTRDSGKNGYRGWYIDDVEGFSRSSCRWF